MQARRTARVVPPRDSQGDPEVGTPPGRAPEAPTFARVRAAVQTYDVEFEEEPDDRPIPAVASQLLLRPRHQNAEDDGAWDHWQPPEGEEAEEEEDQQEDLPPDEDRGPADPGGPPQGDPTHPGPVRGDPERDPPRPQGRVEWLQPHPVPGDPPPTGSTPPSGGATHPWCQAPPVMPPRLPKRVRAEVLRTHSTQAEVLPTWDIRPRRPEVPEPDREAQRSLEPVEPRRPAAMAVLGQVQEVEDDYGAYSLAATSTAAPRRWRPERSAPNPGALFEVREGRVVSGPSGAGTGDPGEGTEVPRGEGGSPR